MRGYKAAVDAALGRSSQALTEWIEERRIRVFHYYLNTLLGQPTALPLAAFFT
jgi:hypothetical protein